MLDLASQKEIWLFLLEELERRNIGLIAVSHSEKLLEEVCHRVIDGRQSGKQTDGWRKKIWISKKCFIR